MMRAARAAAVGLALGLLWGVVARGFMRLLTGSPEFTWSGTLYIVGSAGLVGALVSVVRSQRLAGRSWWWRLLGLPFVLMFAAAGAIMAPGVVGVVMIADRRRWLAVPGVALVGLVVVLVALEPGGALSLRQWAGVAVMLACLAVEGLAARELVRKWRPSMAAEPATQPAGPVGVLA
ncbi:hypothetical protein [Oryzobacter telluris]|uniref:hypothetical protein n=1 Tax=Oryzobacter telluris TaxID=3149179 RepID=UPI00370DB34A